MTKTKIEWTDESWNPLRALNQATGKVGWHCEHASAGCGVPNHGGCYAEAFNKRLGTRLPFKPGHRDDIEMFLDEEMLQMALHWRRPRMIFVCSMTDLFADFVKDEWIDAVFSVAKQCPRHTFQILTKRPQNIRKRLPPDWGDGYPNVWLGTSAEDQQWFDRRWRILQTIPAAVRFISYEPAIGPLRPPKRGPFPDWLISGGESGPRARPLDPQWIRDIIADCRRYGVAPFHKQWGTYRNNPLVTEQRLSVKNAKRADPFAKGGALVDGELVREFPTIKEAKALAQADADRKELVP